MVIGSTYYLYDSALKPSSEVENIFNSGHCFRAQNGQNCESPGVRAIYVFLGFESENGQSFLEVYSRIRIAYGPDAVHRRPYTFSIERRDKS